jgi:hypothetical protein
MLKQRRDAAAAVKAAFLPAEQAQDAAALAAARCLAVALEARASSGVPLGTGLDAIADLARGAALAVEARQSMIEAHRKLAALPAEVGLAVVGWGETGDCPPIEEMPPQGNSRHLKSVA